MPKPKANSEIIEGFRKKVGKAPENQVAESEKSNKNQILPEASYLPDNSKGTENLIKMHRTKLRKLKNGVIHPEGYHGYVEGDGTYAGQKKFHADRINELKKHLTTFSESFDPKNPKLEGDHEGNPTYVYPVTKNKIKVNNIVTYPLVSKNLTVAKEDTSMPGNEGSATHDDPVNVAPSAPVTPNRKVKVQGKVFPAKPNNQTDTNREMRHVPTVQPTPATKVLASPMEEETMSDDQMSRYANYIALHEAKRRGLTESSKARQDAIRAMGPAAKETEHEPEDEPGAKERDEEGNAKGGHGAYVNALQKVGNAGGHVTHADGKKYFVSRMEAKARVADIMSTPAAKGAREDKQKQHFNNPPKAQ